MRLGTDRAGSKVALEDLVQAARRTAARDRQRQPEAVLRAEAEASSATTESSRMSRALRGDGMSIIAEVKGASPLYGPLCADFDPLLLATRYAAGGATALSVLTEESFFAGNLEHLRAVAAEVSLPTLRKDFIVEPYQIYQAATAGAAAVLLIAEVLTLVALRELVEVAHSIGLDALVEVHEPDSIEPAVDSGSGLIGVNNRDLRTMEVDLNRSLELAAEIPKSVLRVSESGVSGRRQVRRLAAAGYDAVLVGTSLVCSEDPAGLIRRLRGEDA